MRVEIRRCHPEARLPQYSRLGDAALDCYATTPVELQPGTVTAVPLGFALAIPEGFVGLLLDRSGLARHDGIFTLGGVIDPNFRGEVTALLTTLGPPRTLPAGSRVCQLLVVPAPSVTWVEVPHLAVTERGTAGFGSSGLS
jgi:dUTP pyrophosphatase